MTETDGDSVLRVGFTGSSVFALPNRTKPNVSLAVNSGIIFIAAALVAIDEVNAGAIATGT